MKKRFILLIDFSEYSGNLIQYAYDWSQQTNASLLLVHQTLVLSPGFATDKESKALITQTENEEALQELKDFVTAIIPNATEIAYLVSESHLELTLKALLAEPFENLIFTGLKGTGLLKKIFIGSVAIQVIEHTNNIIVAIPQEISTFSPEKIFVAVTEKHPLNIVELNKLLNFIDTKSTCITFFYLAKPDEETQTIEKLLNDLATIYGDRFTTKTAIYEGQDRFQDIKKVINNREEEILVIQKGSRFLSDLLFRRFLVNELVHEGKTPLIVLP